MSTERPYAPPDDPDEAPHNTDFELEGDSELDFEDDYVRDLFDERDLEDGDFEDDFDEADIQSW